MILYGSMDSKFQMQQTCILPDGCDVQRPRQAYCVFCACWPIARVPSIFLVKIHKNKFVQSVGSGVLTHLESVSSLCLSWWSLGWSSLHRWYTFALLTARTLRIRVCKCLWRPTYVTGWHLRQDINCGRGKDLTSRAATDNERSSRGHILKVIIHALYCNSFGLTDKLYINSIVCLWLMNDEPILVTIYQSVVTAGPLGELRILVMILTRVSSFGERTIHLCGSLTG
jgi:hypothetical protein